MARISSRSSAKTFLNKIKKTGQPFKFEMDGKKLDIHYSVGQYWLGEHKAKFNANIGDGIDYVWDNRKLLNQELIKQEPKVEQENEDTED